MNDEVNVNEILDDQPRGPNRITHQALIERYVDHQMNTVEGTKRAMWTIQKNREVSGWCLLECQMLGGSRMGELTLLPYGPGCTYKAPPTHPVSPRGLASDMAVVVAVAEGTVGE